MLYHNATDIVMTNEGPLLPGEVIHEEGVALVWVKENGKSYLKLSTGVGDETFAGFAISRNMPAASGTQVEEFVIDSTGLFIISRLPIPSQLLVKIDGAIADQGASATAPTTAGDVSVSGAELRFAAADVGKKVFVQYAFELTVNESRSYTGDAPIGGLASNVVGQVGYIKLGNISTNMFDAGADWAADNVLHPRLGAGGRLTVGGNGTVLKGAIIKQSPTSDRGYVTIEICGPGF